MFSSSPQVEQRRIVDSSVKVFGDEDLDKDDVRWHATNAAYTRQA
jgi:hypothetical protein